MDILVQVVQTGRTIPDLEQAFNVAKTVQPSQITGNSGLPGGVKEERRKA